MSIKLEIFGETGGEVAASLSQLLMHLGAQFTSVSLPPVPTAPAAAPAAEPEALKPTRGRKNQQPAAEQPAAQPEPTPLEKAVDAVKQTPTADEPKFDEAACRAGLQKLASVAKTVATGDEAAKGQSGVQAAMAICTEFGVKKISELKADQHRPFCERIEAVIAEMSKAGGK